MARLDFPGIFAGAALGLLGVAVARKFLAVDVPDALLFGLVAVCMAGMIGTNYREGTGRVYPLRPDSVPGTGTEVRTLSQPFRMPKSELASLLSYWCGRSE